MRFPLTFLCSSLIIASEEFEKKKRNENSIGYYQITFPEERKKQ